MLNRQLPQPELERILAHLAACPLCERHLHELNPELRQYRVHCSAIEKRLEARDWPDIRAAMQRFDSQSARPAEFRARKSVALIFTRPAWFGALAAAVLICALLIWPRLFHSELHAEVLLEKTTGMTDAGDLFGGYNRPIDGNTSTLSAVVFKLAGRGSGAIAGDGATRP